MIGEQAAGTGDGVRNSRCDGLVDRERASTAVMRRGGRVCFAVLALSFFPFAVSLALTFAIPFVFALSLSSRNVVLVEGAMTLLVDVAVAVEAAAGVRRLAIHAAGLLEASFWKFISTGSALHKANPQASGVTASRRYAGRRQRARE